ncbi:MAG: FapA family protein, partial [Oscillospiraceae bacterium]
MKIDEQEAIQIEDLLSDEIIRTRLGSQYNKGLILHQLMDPTLMGLDLDELCDMDIDVLISTVLQAQEFVMIDQARFMEMLELERVGLEHPPVQVCSVPNELSDGEKLLRITFDDSMVEAYIQIAEPENGGSPPDECDFRTALLRSGVLYGIKDDYIDRLVQHPIYNRKIKIAQGKQALSGTDGKVSYHFTPIFDLAPKIDEHGVADYKALDFVQNVKKGDLLCDIVQPTAGTTGISITGEPITGSAGKPSGLVCGTNTVLSEDRTKLYAVCDGQVFLKRKTVYVRRVLTIDNVDAATGNILFVGSVHVKGDVASGFSVRAGGNIIVDGVVENAILVSGNNIIICGGVKGRGDDMLAAEGSARAPYIENARVRVKGDLYADSILNSRVESDRTVRVFGINGKLIGGVCTAGEAVCAKQIGNDANMLTLINVRDPDTFGKKKAQNMLTIAKYREAVAKLTDVAEFAALSHLDITPPEVMLCRAVATKIRIERAIAALELENSETAEQQSHRRYIEA